jgi:hypothetical protein
MRRGRNPHRASLRSSIRSLALLSAIVLLALGTFVPRASAQETSTQIGFLTCSVASGFGWIVGSSRTVDCEYHPADSSYRERYSGTISKIGIDIGYLAPVAMTWAVVVSSGVPHSGGALAGKYFGATAQAAAGIGGGVNVLFGGFEKSVTLQPVSVEGDMGLYVGAGIAALNLQRDEREFSNYNGQQNDTE